MAAVQFGAVMAALQLILLLNLQAHPQLMVEV
jgi:hypothetical protein